MKVVVRDILSKVVDNGGGEFRVVEGDDVVAGTMVTQELDVAVPSDILVYDNLYAMCLQLNGVSVMLASDDGDMDALCDKVEQASHDL